MSEQDDAIEIHTLRDHVRKLEAKLAEANAEIERLKALIEEMYSAQNG